MFDKDENEYVRKMPPCNPNDIGRMESWLTEMATEQGLFFYLYDNSFSGSIKFLVGEPRYRRYRFEPIRDMLSAANPYSSPDEKELRLYRKYGWEYESRLRGFYVFSTDDPEAREMHTDAQVFADALGPACCRWFAQVIIAAIGLSVMAILVFTHSKMFLASGRMTAMLVSLTVFAALGIVYWTISGVKLLGYKKRAAEGEPVEHDSIWVNGSRILGWGWLLIFMTALVMEIQAVSF